MKKFLLWPALALGVVAGGGGAAVAAEPVGDAPAALRVARDPVTGNLRAPTADEAQELATRGRAAADRAAAGSVRASTAPLLRRHSSGAASVRMTDETASQVVAVRQPDGSVSAQCNALGAGGTPTASFAARPTASKE